MQLIKNNKKIFLLIAGCVLGFLLLIFLQIQEARETARQDKTASLSPFLQAPLGTQESAMVKRLSGLKETKKLGSNSTEYIYQAPVNARDNLVVTKNQKVIFEQAVTIQKNYIHPTISSYTEKYGQPEKVITGSKTYGESEAFYIYATKGFTLIVHVASNEVDAIQTYEPTTVTHYLAMWGQEINETKTGKQEERL